jgi:hypothetical protein
MPISARSVLALEIGRLARVDYEKNEFNIGKQLRMRELPHLVARICHSIVFTYNLIKQRYIMVVALM